MSPNRKLPVTSVIQILIIVFMIGVLPLSIVNITAAEETMQFKSEAQKLDFIRKMLKKEKHLRPSEYNATHCSQTLKDLARKNFKAIEPYLKVDSEDDPRLARWNECKQKDYHDVGVDADKFFGSLERLGGPPYRFYKIELDGNLKNGAEDMVYNDTPALSGMAGGYHWVNLNNCEVIDGFPVGSASQFGKKKAVSLNALIYGKGKLWAIEYVEGLEFSMMRWIDRTRMETCQWWLFDPEKAHEPLDGK